MFTCDIGIAIFNLTLHQTSNFKDFLEGFNKRMDSHVKNPVGLMLSVVTLLSLGSLASASDTDSRVGVELRGNLNLSGYSIGLVGQHVEYQDVNRKVTQVGLDSHIDAEYIQTLGGFDFYDGEGDMVTRYGNQTTEESDDILGASFGVHFPLNKNWKKPTVEAKGLVGKTYYHAEGGIGYDLARDEITIPVSVSASYFALGTNVRHPVEDLYVAIDSRGSVDKLDKKSTSITETREQLCSSGSYVVDPSTGNTTCY